MCRLKGLIDFQEIMKPNIHTYHSKSKHILVRMLKFRYKERILGVGGEKIMPPTSVKYQDGFDIFTVISMQGDSLISI